MLSPSSQVAQPGLRDSPNRASTTRGPRPALRACISAHLWEQCLWWGVGNLASWPRPKPAPSMYFKNSSILEHTEQDDPRDEYGHSFVYLRVPEEGEQADVFRYPNMAPSEAGPGGRAALCPGPLVPGCCRVLLHAELATYLIQDLGAEPDLRQLEVEGFSDRAWKPRHPVRHCARQGGGSNQAREGSSLASLPDGTGFGVMGTEPS